MLFSLFGVLSLIITFSSPGVLYIWSWIITIAYLPRIVLQHKRQERGEMEKAIVSVLRTAQLNGNLCGGMSQQELEQRVRTSLSNKKANCRRVLSHLVEQGIVEKANDDSVHSGVYKLVRVGG